MAKVHPKANSAISEWERALVLTVWKKSLLPNCDGFTVFDNRGNLVFRVDNYVGAHKKDHILLMDAAGTPLLTIRRKRLSLGDTWVVLEGEDSGNATLLFTARKHFNILNTKCLAQLLRKNKEIAYEMEGSYAQRCCTFYDKNRRKVAEIKMKDSVPGTGVAFGADIFRLSVQPDMDPTLAMPFLILLDHFDHYQFYHLLCGKTINSLIIFLS